MYSPYRGDSKGRAELTARRLAAQGERVVLTDPALSKTRLTSGV
jgi:hypothetical protein